MILAHAQDDLNLSILRMFEDTVSLDAAQLGLVALSFDVQHREEVRTTNRTLLTLIIVTGGSIVVSVPGVWDMILLGLEQVPEYPIFGSG